MFLKYGVFSGTYFLVKHLYLDTIHATRERSQWKVLIEWLFWAKRYLDRNSDCKMSIKPSFINLTRNTTRKLCSLKLYKFVLNVAGKSTCYQIQTYEIIAFRSIGQYPCEINDLQLKRCYYIKNLGFLKSHSHLIKNVLICFN